jgi:hypothetical protein
MNKTKYTPWVGQLIHQHGRLTHELYHNPDIDEDRADEMRDRIHTILMILDNEHGIDLARDLNS